MHYILLNGLVRQLISVRDFSSDEICYYVIISLLLLFVSRCQSNTLSLSVAPTTLVVVVTLKVAVAQRD